MTSSYTGEDDELDYEDEDYTHRITPHGAHHGMEDEEEEAEEDYEDLYSDVNVGFFPNSAVAPKNDWEKANKGVGDDGHQFSRMGGDCVQGSSRMEACVEEAKAQLGSDYGRRNDQQEGPGNSLMEAEPGLQNDDAGREITGEDQRRCKMQNLDYAKWTRIEAASTPLQVMVEETSLKLTDERNLRNTVADTTEEPTETMNKEDSQQRLEMFLPPPKLTLSSTKDGLGSLGEGSLLEIGAPQTVGRGTNGTGRPSDLADGALPPSAGGGASTVGTDEGAKGEGILSSWDGGSSSRTGAAIRPAGAASGLNRASSANTAHYQSGRGSFQSGDGGNTRLFIGYLHWWTTDAELEAALSDYGRIKNLKFFEERASGKSRGYCEVEFYDSAAARSCKEGMDGRKFNGRPCVVLFASSYTFRQLSATHTGTQSPPTLPPSRRTMDGGMRSASTSIQGGKMGVGGRGHGPGSGRTGHGASFRGRGGLGTRNMGGSGGGGTAQYGQGSPGALTGPSIPPQGMMGQGYDPTYGPAMGRAGSGYGGYVVPRAPPFTGMALPYPTVGPGGLPAIAPHVNPAFFGRGASMNGMGMLVGGSMEGAGGWSEASFSGWRGEENDQRTRESSYGEETGGIDYSYGGDVGYDRGRVGVTRVKVKGRDGERGPYGERRSREDRDVDWEREKFRERGKDWDWEDEDYERERHARTRNKPRTADDDEQSSRSREEDYGKRRRMVR